MSHQKYMSQPHKSCSIYSSLRKKSEFKGVSCTTQSTKEQCVVENRITHLEFAGCCKMHILKFQTKLIFFNKGASIGIRLNNTTPKKQIPKSAITRTLDKYVDFQKFMGSKEHTTKSSSAKMHILPVCPILLEPQC